MNKTQIKFGDLSTPLKTAVVISYVYGALMIIAFLTGFLEGLVGV